MDSIKIVTPRGNKSEPQSSPEFMCGLAREAVPYLQRVRKCPICGTECSTEPFLPPSGRIFIRILRPSNQSTPTRLSHSETVHPQYSAFFIRWVKTLFLAGIVAASILIVGDYAAFEMHNETLLLAVTISYIVFMQAILWQVPLKLRQMRRQWRQEHGKD